MVGAAMRGHMAMPLLGNRFIGQGRSNIIGMGIGMVNYYPFIQDCVHLEINLAEIPENVFCRKSILVYKSNGREGVCLHISPIFRVCWAWRSSDFDVLNLSNLEEELL